MTTPAERAALRDRIAGILLSDPCQRIRFTIAGYEVTPGAYAVIGLSMETGGVSYPDAHRRRAMNVRIDQLPPGAGAQYEYETNTIVVPRADYGQTVLERSSLVHESTHAIFDFNRVRLPALTEEAAAYIAAAMFERMAGEAPAATGQFAVAATIAEDLAPPAGARGLAPWSRTVTPQQLDALITAIRARPVYAPVRSRGPGYRYRHNGGTL